RERRAAHRHLYDAIVRAQRSVRDAVVDAALRWRGANGVDAVRRRMNGAEIAELASRNGHSIGAHSVTHAMLPCEPPHVQRREIDDSCRTLAGLVGCRIRAFAYPYGAFDDRTVDAAREAGCEIAVTCKDETVASGLDSLRLPRLEVTPERSARFAEWLSRLI